MSSIDGKKKPAEAGLSMCSCFLLIEQQQQIGHKHKDKKRNRDNFRYLNELLFNSSAFVFAEECVSAAGNGAGKTRVFAFLQKNDYNNHNGRYD